MKKIKVAILFGGKSAEHEVSIRSARTVYNIIDRKKYKPIPVAISMAGQWLSPQQSQIILEKNIWPSKKNLRTVILSQENGKIIDGKNKTSVDVVFPILHGPYGEDGSMQGFIKIANLPFVGPGVLGSAVGMDKDVMKRLLREAKIPIGNFLIFYRHEKKNIFFDKIKKTLGTPFFVKPANLGSSVGISKVYNQKGFKKAINSAFLYDKKIIVEENIKGREIECAVIGNENVEASTLGEIILQNEFYSYDAKYFDNKGTVTKIPAKFSKTMIKKIKILAIKSYKVLCCEGLARVDFFVKENGSILVNEINTLPGFTSISMYPKLWEASGLSNTNLVSRLIDLAFDRYKNENNYKMAH